jgi:hypothetical protein
MNDTEQGYHRRCGAGLQNLLDAAPGLRPTIDRAVFLRARC